MQWTIRHNTSQEELDELLPELDIVLTNKVALRKNAVSTMKPGALISMLATGYNIIDVDTEPSEDLLAKIADVDGVIKVRAL